MCMHKKEKSVANKIKSEERYWGQFISTDRVVRGIYWPSGRGGGPEVFLREFLDFSHLIASISSSTGVDCFRIAASFLSLAWNGSVMSAYCDRGEKLLCHKLELFVRFHIWKVLARWLLPAVRVLSFGFGCQGFVHTFSGIMFKCFRSSIVRL